MDNNKKKNLLALVSAAMLGLSLLNGWPYDFFTVLRIVVCASAAYIAWLTTEEGETNWTWVFVVVAILFNPIFIISLKRATWLPIDALTGVFMVVSMFFLKFHKKS